MTKTPTRGRGISGHTPDATPIHHDTFDDEGHWSPPDHAELYFHSGLSEPAFGLERDGLGAFNDDAVLHAVVQLVTASATLRDLPASEREQQEVALMRHAIRAALSRVE